MVVLVWEFRENAIIEISLQVPNKHVEPTLEGYY